MVLLKIYLGDIQGWGFCHKSCQNTGAGFMNTLQKVKIIFQLMNIFFQTFYLLIAGGANDAG